MPPPSPEDVAIITLPLDRWQEYRDLRLAALAAEPTAFSEPYDRAAQRSPTEWQERLASTSSWLVFAERAGRLVALAGAFPSPGEPGVVTIVSVYVDASFRGLGIGRKLLSSLIERITAGGDASLLRLHVNDTNASAIALYESLGFAMVGIERDVLQHDGVSYDELVMERTIRSSSG